MASPVREIGADDLMLLQLARQPFSRNGWLFEMKYDGFRALTHGGPRGAALISRNGRSLLPFFPEIERAIKALPTGTYDAELVVCDARGHPSFSLISSRHRITRPRFVAAAARDTPALLCVFDLLIEGGTDLRGEPLERRKALLREAATDVPGIIVVPGVEAHGEALFREARERNLEGIVGKRLEAGYRRGRSAHWVKIKNPDYRRDTRVRE